MRARHLLPAAVMAAIPLTVSGGKARPWDGLPIPPETRQVPVVVRAEVKPAVVKAGEPIPLTITIANRLEGPIYHNTFRVAPVEWNGETVNVNLVDVFRKGTPSNRCLARPKLDVPSNISGMGRTRIDPGGTLTIRTDARKWTLRDGWLPGRYWIIACVERLTADDYCSLRVLSDPFEFEIR